MMTLILEGLMLAGVVSKQSVGSVPLYQVEWLVEVLGKPDPGDPPTSLETSPKEFLGP